MCYRIMNGKQMVKLLEKNGFYLKKVTGSHYIMMKEGYGIVPVPVHGGKDINKRTELRILKMAGLK